MCFAFNRVQLVHRRVQRYLCNHSSRDSQTSVPIAVSEDFCRLLGLVAMLKGELRFVKIEHKPRWSCYLAESVCNAV